MAVGGAAVFLHFVAVHRPAAAFVAQQPTEVPSPRPERSPIALDEVGPGGQPTPTEGGAVISYKSIPQADVIDTIVQVSQLRQSDSIRREPRLDQRFR